MQLAVDPSEPGHSRLFIVKMVVPMIGWICVWIWNQRGKWCWVERILRWGAGVEG